MNNIKEILIVHLYHQKEINLEFLSLYLNVRQVMTVSYKLLGSLCELLLLLIDS